VNRSIWDLIWFKVTYSTNPSIPNPFNPTTTISFTLPETSETRLTVYDILGREVEVLVNGVLGTGTHQATYEAGDLPSGMYTYRLTAGDFSQSRLMMLVK